MCVPVCQCVITTSTPNCSTAAAVNINDLLLLLRQCGQERRSAKENDGGLAINIRLPLPTGVPRKGTTTADSEVD